MSSNLVETRAGTFKGITRDGLNTFVGIRYARPVVGALRFRPPQPLDDAAETIDATRYGDRNFQVGQPEEFEAMMELHGGESEDCLFLNVYAPADADAPVPVLVWIHGGAFIGGSGNQYDPSNLVRRNGVIVVTINYRLGVFGFLNLSRLGDEYEGSANLGMQDQIAALGWVNEHIAAFGGDDSNISIFGESAGAASVNALMGAPGARGLFHKAMAFSGTEILAPPMEHLDAIRAHFGVDSDQACLERLRALPATDLSQLQQDLRLYVGASIDGTVITQSTTDAIKTGAAAHIPILTGSTKDEGTLLAPAFTEFAHEAVATIFGLSMTIGGDDGAAYRDFLDRHYGSEDLVGRMSRTWVDAFRSGAVRIASVASEHGAGGWVYSFDLETEHALGTTHGSDIPFIFDWTGEGSTRLFVHDPTASNLAMAEKWSKTLVAFARTGDPNGAGLPSWPRYAPDDFPSLRLSREPEIVANSDGEMLDLYRVGRASS